MNNQPYDYGYRHLFSHPKIVSDLLTGFVKEDWVTYLDLKTLERVDTQQVSDKLDKREQDSVWRVKFNNEWFYLYVLIEFQKNIHKYMGIRLLTYVSLLQENLIKTKSILPDGKLPPVLPFVVYMGDREWNAATQVHQLYPENLPRMLLKHQPDMAYLILDINHTALTQEMLESKNLLIPLIELEQNQEGIESLKEIVARLSQLLASSEYDSLRRAFLVYCNRVLELDKTILIDLDDTRGGHTMLADRVKIWKEELRQECRKEGLEQGQKSTLCAVLTGKFGKLPKAVENKIFSLSEVQRQVLIARIWDIKSLDDLLREELPNL